MAQPYNRGQKSSGPGPTRLSDKSRKMRELEDSALKTNGE